MPETNDSFPTQGNMQNDRPLDMNQKTLKNSSLNEINELLLDAEEKYTINGRVTSYYMDIVQNALILVRSIFFDLTPEEMYDGLIFGQDMLKRGLSGYMIAKGFFSEELLPVMIQTVHDDCEFAYKFIFTLQEHLSRDELVDIIGVAFKSQHHNVRWNALSVTRKEQLTELLSLVEGLMQSPGKPERSLATKIFNELQSKE